MGYVENYTFINIEDINSTLINHGIEFEDFYDLDTRLLELDPSLEYHDYRIDFCILSKTKLGSTYEYILEVRNSLWDGGYTFIRLPEGVTMPQVIHMAENPNILRINGENLTDFTIRLHLTNYADNRILNSNNLIIKGLIDVEAPYYETNTLNVKLLYSNGTPVVNAEFKIIMNNKDSDIFKTNASGETELIIPSANPGVYTAIITATKDNLTAKRTILVTRTKANIQFSIDDSKTYIKGAINKATLNFDVTNINKEQLENLQITISNDNIGVSIANIENGKAEFYFSLRGYYKDTVPLNIVINESEYTNVINSSITLNCDYFYAYNYEELEDECENSLGADLIRLKTGSSYDYTNDGIDMISIDRDITIEGEKTGNGWSTLYGKGNGFFTVKKDATLQVKGIKFYKCNPAIYQEKNSSLYIEGCLFEEGDNEKHAWMGACVYTDTSPECKNNKKLFNTIVKNSYFYNNVGSCFSHGGQLNIDGCYFLKDSLNSLYQPEPQIVSQQYGDCSIRNSYICIDTGNDISPSNKSYAKTVFWCGKFAAVNGKTGLNMAADNSTNLFTSQYNNIAYTYTKYYYPHSDINANLVASPIKGYERKAASHAVEGHNWAWKDGIQLTRVSWGTDNTNNKLSIKIPTSGGYY